MRKLLFGIAISFLLFGCASTDTKEQPGATVEERKPSMTDTQPPPRTDTTPRATPIESQPIGGANALKDPNNILSKRSVYFDYDSSVVKDEFKPLVTAHARYLQQNRSAKLVIQGNTDERGSREYNIALGQRRADSIRQMMVLLGAQDAQIESVSFGEEKPRSTGKDEAAFSENRRGDIVYQGE
jgi:peptidoglycan-associated lipoprotein